MASDIENCCKFIDLGQNVGQLDGVFPEIRVVLLVFYAYCIIRRSRHLFGTGIERRFASIGRCNHDLCLVFEGLIRMNEFGLSSGILLVPFTSGRRITYQVPASGIAIWKFFVRREDEEDLRCHFNCSLLNEVLQ